MELGYFNKQFAKNTRRKNPTRKGLELFLLDTLKTILNRKFDLKTNTITAFFPNSMQFF